MVNYLKHMSLVFSCLSINRQLTMLVVMLI